MFEPSKPADVVGREREWARLARLWSSPEPEVAFLLGQRRVGKSYLLAPFARAVDGVYYQATRRGEEEQLRRLAARLAKRFDDPGLRHTGPFRDWHALLDYVKERAGTEPFLLVLDEFPYLQEASPGIASVLQDWIDHDLPGTRIKLILSGSYISAMKRLEAADQPLHDRRTLRLLFQPFDCAQATAFYPDLAPRDQIRTYAIFGGLPGRLAQIDPERTVAENVADRILDPGARLHDEAQRVLDGFRIESEVHYSILSAIAGGEHTWRGITSRIGRSSGTVSRPMRWLLDMGLVQRFVPITERHPERSKAALYRLTDPHLIFWNRFLAPILEAGLPASLRAHTLWERRIEPHLDDHTGPVFEQLARDFVARTTDLPFQPERVGGWWNNPRGATPREEIDVVALSGDGEALVAECKWGPIHRDDLGKLRNRAARLQTTLGGLHRLHLAIFTGEPPPPDLDLREIRRYGPEDLCRL